ncbi:DNA-directed DNA polymerase protein [Dioscorea alata]|uniref:DNA-directed DNA polymerase protein n=2 Tax=Dioscorea alata TaxID=55571 RepID=A0ACB7WSJ6_DIOAL|nr:DNA-directed DNA polymerase protein [Dioscorea alata]KAH7691462.1 DNA-directed DNA polymerase protein [Dioscorea alata]
MKSSIKKTITKKKSMSESDDVSSALGKEKRTTINTEERKKSQKRPKANNKEKQKQKEKEKKRKGASSSSSSSTSSTSWGAVATCSFPMSRVWRLVRSEGCQGSAIDTRTTQDAVFLINKAAEMFLEKFTEDVYANAKHKKSVAYKNLSSTVYKEKKYEFLSDFIPEKLRGEDALKAKAE